MTAAFARETDARFALAILASSPGRILSSTLRPIAGAGGRVDLVMLDVDIADLAPERMAVAMTGAHGVVMSTERREPEAREPRDPRGPRDPMPAAPPARVRAIA
jgi:hypothetical protein